MKKTFRKLLLIMLSFCLAGCSALNNKNTDTELYQLYKNECDSGYVGSYADWLKEVIDNSKKEPSQPQLRVNEDTDEWEISYDGISWNGLGITLYGEKYVKPDLTDDINNISIINNLLSLQNNLITKDDYINFIKENKLSLLSGYNDYVYVIDTVGKRVVLANNKKNKIVYPTSVEDFSYASYSFIKEKKTIDITPISFTKNSAYSTINATKATFQSSSFFETAKIDLRICWKRN